MFARVAEALIAPPTSLPLARRGARLSLEPLLGDQGN